MYEYRRLLVGLKLGEVDAAVIRYAAMISRCTRSQRVYFLHVAETLDIPESVRREFPEVAATPEDAAEQAMRNAVAEHFTNAGPAEARFEVAEGSPLIQMLSRCRRHDIDLVITGREASKPEGGPLARRLALKAPCSVLIVPSAAQEVVDNILVPVDFSPNSADALDVALQIARCVAGARVECLHVYHVPIGYHRSGKTYEQFAQIMRGHADRDCRQFLQKVDAGGVKIDTELMLDETASHAVAQQVMRRQADLVVIGARGRGAGASVLLGSTAEQVIRACPVPLLAVKPKGAGMSILEALLNL